MRWVVRIPLHLPVLLLKKNPNMIKNKGLTQVHKILKTLLISCSTISSSRKPSQIPNKLMMCSNNSVYLSHISLSFLNFTFLFASNYLSVFPNKVLFIIFRAIWTIIYLQGVTQCLIYSKCSRNVDQLSKLMSWNWWVLCWFQFKQLTSNVVIIQQSIALVTSLTTCVFIPWLPFLFGESNAILFHWAFSIQFYLEQVSLSLSLSLSLFFFTNLFDPYLT